MTENYKLIYDQFISAMSEKVYPLETPLESHHILPKHAGGGNEPENKISLSAEDHNLAHFYRYLSFKERGDQLAVTLRRKQTTAMRQKTQRVILERNRERKNLFWNLEWQSTQGKKGGPKGGSANTLLQFEARQRVGRQFGSIVGRSRQSERLKESLSRRMIWRYSSKDLGEISIETAPCDTFRALTEQLENCVPNQIRNISSLTKVLHGERKRIYGWSLISMAIRSEAGDGQIDPPERSETSA